MREVFAVELRNNRVNPAATCLAALLDQLRIGRSDHHRWEAPNVIGEPVVRFFIAAKYLFDPAFHRTADFFLLIMAGKRALNEHVGFAVSDVLAVYGVEITLRVAEVMDCIEHVGFAAAVVPQQTIHLRSKGQIRPVVVFEMKQVKMFENHDANFTIFARPWTRNFKSNYKPMAKKTKPEDDTLLDVGEVYTKTERFVDENRNTLTYGVGGLAVLILAVIGYQSFIVGPAEAAAESDTWRSENYFEMDSLSLAALGDGYSAGLEEIMADYDGTPAGQRAAYRMGIYYRDAGDFEAAIDAFEQVDVNDDVVQVLAAGNIGDCFVELADFDGAQGAFEQAISLASSSLAEDVLAPMFLYKGALVEIELGNASQAKKYLDRIVEDYSTSQQKNASEALAASLAE